MNKSCIVCARYKDTLRCCVKGCKEDLCEDCVHFLRIVIDPSSAVYVLPMCSQHAIFAREGMLSSPAAMQREKVASWLQDNINPVNPDRLMRFISTASSNIPTIH